MIKPIFIVSFSHEIVKSAGDNFLEERLMMLMELLGDDYHVLVTEHNSLENIKFDCFNAPELDEKSLKELKELVKNRINECKEIPINQNI